MACTKWACYPPSNAAPEKWPNESSVRERVAYSEVRRPTLYANDLAPDTEKGEPRIH
jgi:hypothetical protein